MYVGVTRAMKRLYLLAAKRRMLFGDFQSNALSRFVEDIPEELTHSQGVQKSIGSIGNRSGNTTFNSPFKINLPQKEIAENKFKDGDRVRHAGYGEGIVVERRGDLLSVAFENKFFGIRKFAANIAPLEKI